MARRHKLGQSARLGSAVQTKAISFANRSRQGDHRRALERATVLRSAGQAKAGGESWLEVTALLSGVRYIRASPPRKGWNRTSTRCTHSVRPAKHSSRVRPARAGARLKRGTTTADFLARLWSDRP